VSWAIIGCGYVGERLLDRLLRSGEHVIATTRSSARAAALGPSARVVDPYDEPALSRHLPPGGVVVDSIPPDAARGPHARALVSAGVRRIVYLSATSVYGRQAGWPGWIDEDTPAAPDNPRGLARLAEEEALFSLAAGAGVEAVSLRIAAIYGPGRGLQDRIRTGQYRVVDDGSGFVSRIHVDDLVAVIIAAARIRPLVRPIYVVGDDEPTTVRAHADGVAAALGLPPPPSIPRSKAPAVTVEMQTGNRRVANAHLKGELGITLAYPSWREGLRSILATSV
jgi:nucleoside-diphosphate-sugar epimerase